MTPRRLVASLLEADDMLPPVGDPAPEEMAFDTKDMLSRPENPLPVQGIPINGFYRDLMRRFERQNRLKRDGPEEFFKIENNTFLVRNIRENTLAVRFHYTDIITVTPEDTLTVDNGGYLTKTTLVRLNEYLPGGWGIYQQGGEWWWNLHNNDDQENPGFKRLQPWSRGDTINADGLLQPMAPAEYKRTRKPKALPGEQY